MRTSNLQTMSQGMVPGYDNTELDLIKKEVLPLVHDLAASMEDEVIPIPKKLGSY
jgi:hypothetical protein